MIDPALVQSRFDIEILLSERGFQYALLALVDSGRIPTTIAASGTINLVVRPPPAIDRTYPLDPTAPPLPPPLEGSFAVSFAPGLPNGADAKITVLADAVDTTTGMVRCPGCVLDLYVLSLIHISEPT